MVRAFAAFVEDFLVGLCINQYTHLHCMCLRSEIVIISIGSAMINISLQNKLSNGNSYRSSRNVAVITQVLSTFT